MRQLRLAQVVRRALSVDSSRAHNTHNSASACSMGICGFNRSFLVARGASSSTYARWAPVMLRAGTGNCLVYSGFNVALWLAAHGRKFRDNKVAGPLQHSLLTK